MLLWILIYPGANFGTSVHTGTAGGSGRDAHGVGFRRSALFDSASTKGRVLERKNKNAPLCLLELADFSRSTSGSLGCC